MVGTLDFYKWKELSLILKLDAEEARVPQMAQLKRVCNIIKKKKGFSVYKRFNIILVAKLKE